MIEIRNVAKDVDDGKHRQRDSTAINRIAVHRCGVDLIWNQLIGYDAISICDAFAGRDPKWRDTVAKATGNEIPYSFMIGGNLGPEEFDGLIWQTLPVFEVGAHARRWNTTAIGVAVIADPRVRPCSEAQRRALIHLLADLCQAFTISPPFADDDGVWYLAAHDELPSAADAGKHCPGKYLPMNEIRRSVAAEIAKRNRTDALNRLIAAGMTV